MSVAGVVTTFNEADIIEACLRHHFAEGLDAIFVADASTDDTPNILHGLADEFPLHVFRDTEDYHFQPEWTKKLADYANDHGHEWIVPFDSDEFFYAPGGATIADTLGCVPESITKIHVRMYGHRDWDCMFPGEKPLPKVVWRYHKDAQPHNGNHDCNLPGASVWDVLELREIQYRSETQFIRKVRERVQTLDPALTEQSGTHHRDLNRKSDDELRAEWLRICGEEVRWAPIPSRSSFRPTVTLPSPGNVSTV